MNWGACVLPPSFPEFSLPFTLFFWVEYRGKEHSSKHWSNSLHRESAKLYDQLQTLKLDITQIANSPVLHFQHFWPIESPANPDIDKRTYELSLFFVCCYFFFFFFSFLFQALLIFLISLENTYFAAMSYHTRVAKVYKVYETSQRTQLSGVMLKFFSSYQLLKTKKHSVIIRLSCSGFSFNERFKVNKLVHIV